MKKLLLIVLSVLAISSANASTKIGDLYYNLNLTAMTAEVTYYSSNASANENYVIGDIVIPTKVNYNYVDYIVTSIGNSAFNGCSNLKNVEIANSVTSIGNLAFYGCREIKSIEIPNSVTSIGDHAFYACLSLSNVNLKDGESLISLGYNTYSQKYEGEGLFSDCPLKTLHLGRNLTYNSDSSYGYSPFANQTELTSVTIGNSVTYLKDYLFYNNIALTKIEIPDSVNYIGLFSFFGCSGLTNVTIPTSVTEIGSNAFNYCSSLTSVEFNAENCITCGSNFFSAFPMSITSVTFGNKVKNIPDYFFNGCSGITTIDLPNSVTSIGVQAFQDCTALNSVVIPNSVTSIGTKAFYGCGNLTNVEIGNSIISIGSHAFKDCISLTSVEIPNSVTSIGSSVFENCKSLNQITMGNSITEIDSSAFRGCIALTRVAIPNSVTSIGVQAFRDCTALNSVVIPNSVTSIGTEAFFGCGNLANVEIGNSIISIGFYAFKDCISLTSVEIPNSVTSIGYAVFENCKSLNQITMGNSISEIDSFAFRGCSALTRVVIPNSVTSIGSNAFESCTSLNEVVFQDGVATLEIMSNGSSNLFRSCTLEKIYLGRTFSYNSGPSFEYSPLANQTELTSVIVGNNVKSVPDYLFYGCCGLRSIVIGNSVTSIGNYAFYCCENLDEIFYSPESQLASLSSNTFDDIHYESSVLYVTNPVKIQEILTSGDWSNFSKIIYLSEGNKYVPIIWEIPVWLSGEGIVFKNENLLLSKIGNEVNLKCDNTLMAILNGRDITTDITSLSGYSFKPSIIWKLNTIMGVLKGEELSIIVDMPAPGELFNQIGIQNIQKIETLKIIGDFNGTDVMTINRMTNLKNLNLSEANIVEGGQTYRDDLKTSSNIIGGYFFYNCNNLKCIILPNSAISIESNSFEGRSSLINVIIGSKITSIGEYAFSGCHGLTNIIIPNSVTEIFANAFLECTSLKEIILEEGQTTLNLGNPTLTDNPALFRSCPLDNVYIGRNLDYPWWYTDTESPFCNNVYLKEVSLGNQVTYLNEKLFYGCSNLTTVEIPNSVTSIGDYVFNGCTGLNSIEIPNSVTSIGHYVFNGCTGLNSIEIPNSVTSIGYGAFKGCTGLTCIEIPNSVTSIGDYVFNGCTGLNSIEIPNSVTSIGDYAFYDCTDLNSIEIPNSVTSIGDYVFNGCTGLNNIEIPNSVTSIGYGAFKGCTGLTCIEIPNSVTSIGGYAFYGCTGLNSIEIPNSITSIGDYDFYGCISLNSIEIPNSVLSIGNGAFYNCSGLTNLTIPDSVTVIGNEAFYGCRGIKSLEIPNSVTSIGDQAFYACFSLSNVNLKDGESLISLGYNTYSQKEGEGLFADCPLETLHLGRNISYSSGSSYGYSPFANQTKLTDVTIGNKVTSLKDYLFYNNIALTKIELPDSVNNIGLFSFSGCTGLTSIKIPNSVTSLSFDTFSRCTSIKEVTLEDGNESLNLDSNLFEDCPLEMIYIGRNLFYLSDSYNGFSPFTNQTKLTSVTFGNNVTSIPKFLFSECSSLPRVTIPNSVIEIGDYAFYGCTGLEIMVLADKLQAIGDNAFKGCSSLVKLYSLNPTPPKINASVFDGVDKEECLLIVAKGNLSYYWLDPVWREFLNMSDDLIYLYPLPNTKYGDASIDLEDYAPEGVTLTYETTNDEVALLHGSILTIVGAGEATIVASYEQSGTPMEVIGQMRQFVVDKAELTVSVECSDVYEGQQIPALSLNVSGLCYDDTLENIEELPTAICSATPESAPGEYPIVFLGGKDKNYNFIFAESKVTVKERRKITISLPEIVTYGDDPLDFSQYTPEGEIVTYSIFDSDIAEIKDNFLIIKGAGKVNIQASLPEDTFDAILSTSEFILTIDKADLTIKVQDVTIVEGEDIPMFILTAEGLCYDDMLEDIGKLPEIICEANKGSTPGVYPIYLEGGESQNYNLILEDGILTILEAYTSTISGFEDYSNDRIIVVNYNGVILYQGPEDNMGSLDSGVYILVKGQNSKKLVVN